MLAYLTEENAFTEAGLAHTEKLQQRIFDEIKTRVRETDVSAPVAHGDWEYYARTVEGRDYAIHCRRPAGAGTTLPSADAPPGTTPGEQVILDENELAASHDYFGFRGLAISPRHQLLAYSSDVDGGERATLRFRDLATGADLDDEVRDTYYGLAWANDDRTIFYVRPDDAMRPFQIWRHVVGTPVADDQLVLQEDDERFYASVRRARSGRVLIISVASKLTTEVHLVDAANPAGSPRCVAPREHGIEYHVEHHVDPEAGDRLFVHTNADGAENFKLMVCDADDSKRDSWREVVAHRADVRLADVDVFARHIVLSERSQGLEQLRVVSLDARGEPRPDAGVVGMPDDVYSVWVGSNPEFDTVTLRYGYTSMVAPMTDVDYDLDAGTRRIVKVQPVEGYDAEAFETRRVWATASDGTRVPISLVHRRDLPRDGTAPLLLYGYGSYEVSIDPTFSTARVSLLARGMVFAIAHVRGGGELGRPWYEDGKLDRKRNTFTDFIACARAPGRRGVHVRGSPRCTRR